MTKEQLEKEAKKRYKPGTIYKGILNSKTLNRTSIVLDNDIIKIYDEKINIAFVGVINHPGYIYYKGEWAVIIKKSDKVIEIW